MAHLFSKIVLKDALKNISIPDIESKIALLQEWNEMYQKGELQKKKETAFEATYSEKLFGTILGYTDVSGGLYTREKHPKNASNGQTCDIGLGYYSSEKNETQAVVELKDAGTSIDRPQQREGNMTPIQQGFKYKPLYNSRWVIVSNYYEFRLYRDTYQDYEVWTLADLVNPTNDYEKFRIFYLLLRAESLLSETGESETEKLLAKVRIEQETITKKFYKEYSGLREELMRDIWKNNPTLRNESVVTITQRIIDRIVFVHFCEDRGLLPQNKLAENLTRAKEIDLTPWEVLMLYFRGIDRGSEKLGIPDGYNGGLFRDEDDVIKNLKVSDDVITKFIELGRYDFSDEGGQLSVEILGHIFEQSISDLESIREKIKNPGGESGEKKVSKRKKDGIFYTPAYIVDYIVRNSLGKYLEEHEERLKEEFKLKGDINEKNYRKRELEAYTEYQKILHTVKVLDPACGSGAFLVRVFDFLLAENIRVEKILSGDEQTLSLAERDPSAFFGEILKNNIYGVDLNEESVEITKLSLWLKSAVRGKKLETLDNNIKCGNSLIDDPAVAGDKAFNWNTEFADIMASGGFDVIVGNPPYVNAMQLKKILSEKEYLFLKKKYKTAVGTVDLYIYFFELGLLLGKEKGFLSFITPNRYLSASYGEGLRQYIYDNALILKLADFSAINVFDEASTYPVICVLRKIKNTKNYDIIVDKFSLNSFQELFFNSSLLSITEEKIWGFLLNDGITIVRKVMEKSIPLASYCSINATSTAKEADEYSSLISEDGGEHRMINTGTIDRYISLWGIETLTDKGKQYKYPSVQLDKIPNENRRKLYSSPKIIFAKIALYPEAFYDKNGEYASINTNCLYNFSEKVTPEYLLCFVNSSLFRFCFETFFDGLRMAGGYLLYSAPNLRNMFIFDIGNLSQMNFVQHAENMSTLNHELMEKNNNFLKNIQAKYSVSKITRKLEKWWELDFSEFLKETKISVSLAEQEELMQYFETRRAEVRAIDAEIRKTDTEIDNMVFDLYGLTEEERRVVLGS